MVRPIAPEGFDRIEAREGGTEPLWVKERHPGVFTSVWMIQNVQAMKLLRSGKRVAMTLVVDTNVPGHPSVSLCLQPIAIVPD